MTLYRGATRAWSKLLVVSLAGKDFSQNSGQKENEKYAALVEDFNEKQAANINHNERYLTQLNMPEFAWKNYQKLFENCVDEKFADAAENDEWRRLNTFSCNLLRWITFQMK